MLMLIGWSTSPASLRFFHWATSILMITYTASEIITQALPQVCKMLDDYILISLAYKTSAVAYSITHVVIVSTFDICFMTRAVHPALYGVLRTSKTVS